MKVDQKYQFHNQIFLLKKIPLQASTMDSGLSGGSLRT